MIPVTVRYKLDSVAISNHYQEVIMTAYKIMPFVIFILRAIRQSSISITIKFEYYTIFDNVLLCDRLICWASSLWMLSSLFV